MPCYFIRMSSLDVSIIFAHSGACHDNRKMNLMPEKCAARVSPPTLVLFYKDANTGELITLVYKEAYWFILVSFQEKVGDVLCRCGDLEQMSSK